MRLLSAAGFTLAVLISAPAFAQDTSPQTGDDDYHTDQAIVVTAPSRQTFACGAVMRIKAAIDFSALNSW